jgi:lipopolysaccharide export system ATP-binding protein
MNTLDEFHEYIEALTGHDLSVAVAITELLRGADELGGMERVAWIAAVRDAYAHRSAGRVRSDVGAAEGNSQYLEEQVVARLEGADLVVRRPPGRAWETLSFPSDLWDAVRGVRDVSLGVAEVVVAKLAGGGAPAADGTSEVDLSEGSRLHARNLTKIYRKRRVVDDVAINVRQGEIVGLLGPNGAGKTTTFYMMVGLIPPHEGTVALDDADITKVPMYRRARMGIGYLAQEPSVFRKLSVEDNVMAILETVKMPRRERKARLEDLLAELSLTHLRKNKAYSLSGGERRRLEITRAMVQRPKFMLLDEPFAGIDPIAVNDIQQIVAELKHRGIGVIISDHNVEQTLEIVDRAYIMYEGRIRVSGTVSELVWNDEVADIYLGPTLTQRMRLRFERPTSNV